MFSQFLPRRKSLLSVRAWIKTPATVPQDCLLGEVRLWRKRMNENLFRAFLYTECAYLGCEPQRRREIGAPSFRRTQAPFASTTTSCSCSPWFFVLLFPHDKNFAFIFDMQALVRLFLPCGSPCVRSTSACAVLLATPGAQSAVARLSADLYCKHPVCRSLLATN